jgi:plastocyanin
MRTHTIVVGIVAALFLAGGASAVMTPKLGGSVGPGFTISLTQSGKKVTKLKPGRYSLVVSDKSSFHNFHLRGPGVNKATTVGGTGNRTWALALRKGTYTFVCDPHAATMKGSFRVQ